MLAIDHCAIDQLLTNCDAIQFHRFKTKSYAENDFWIKLSPSLVIESIARPFPTNENHMKQTTNEIANNADKFWVFLVDRLIIWFDRRLTPVRTWLIWWMIKWLFWRERDASDLFRCLWSKISYSSQENCPNTMRFRNENLNRIQISIEIDKELKQMRNK